MPVSKKYELSELREPEATDLEWTAATIDNGTRIVLNAKAEGNQEYRILALCKGLDPRETNDLMRLQKRETNESNFYDFAEGRILKGFQDIAKVDIRHLAELPGLGRIDGPGGSFGPPTTPWGKVEKIQRLAPEAFYIFTMEWGGIKLQGSMQRNMPASLKIRGGWYLEGDGTCKVVTAYPDLFTCFERQEAESRLRDRFPEAWEAFYGVELKEGESYNRDKEIHFERLKDEIVSVLIVMRETVNKAPPGFARVWARKGMRTYDPKEQDDPVYQFLVREDEIWEFKNKAYAIGRPWMPFVLDPARHQNVDGTIWAEPVPSDLYCRPLIGGAAFHEKVRKYGLE